MLRLPVHVAQNLVACVVAPQLSWGVLNVGVHEKELVRAKTAI